MEFALGFCQKPNANSITNIFENKFENIQYGTGDHRLFKYGNIP